MRARPSLTRRQLLGTAATLPLLALLRNRAWANAPIPDELTAATLDGSTTVLSRRDVEDFRASLRGPVLLSADEGYDGARKVWNAAIDRHPALIARCVGVTDVSRALQFASTHKLLVAVRGGGHSTSGASVCERGLMIDLSLMQGVRVAPDLDTVRAEPGVLLGAIDREALAHDRVTTTGMVSHTGAAGLTLGGGCGRLARRFGLTVDNLRSVDIVTPDGVLRAASAQENPDLYWAVRGGSGNFGVVTSFEYQLHPFEPVVFGGSIQFAAADARKLLRFFSAFIADAPDELWVTTSIGDAEAADDRTVTFDICYSGPRAQAEQVLAPLRRFRKPMRTELGPVAYGKLQTSLDHEGRHGLKRYQTSGYLTKIDDALIDKALSHFEKAATAPLRVMIMPWGGRRHRESAEGCDRVLASRRIVERQRRGHVGKPGGRGSEDDARQGGLERHPAADARVLCELHHGPHQRDDAGHLRRQLRAPCAHQEEVRPDEPAAHERERHPRDLIALNLIDRCRSRR